MRRPETAGGWCRSSAEANQRLSSAVADALVPCLVDGESGLHHLVEPPARKRAHRHQQRAGKLRQHRLGVFLELREAALRIGDEVPLVDREDEPAPFALHQIGDGEVLLFEGRFGVEQEHDHLGEADRAKRVAHRQQFGARGDARFAAQARRIEQPDRPPAQVNSAAMASRVRPASGPVIMRSSPSSALASVDFPAFGRPAMASLSGRSCAPSSALRPRLPRRAPRCSLRASRRSDTSDSKSEKPSACSAESASGSPSPSSKAL